MPGFRLSRGLQGAKPNTVITPPSGGGGGAAPYTRLGIYATKEGVTDPLKQPNWTVASTELGITNIHARRLYCIANPGTAADPGANTQTVGVHQNWTATVGKPQDIVPILSLKAYDYNNYVDQVAQNKAELLTWTQFPPGGVQVCYEHEPMKNIDPLGNAMTGQIFQNFNRANIQMCAELQQAGLPVFPCVIANGFTWNIKRAARNVYPNHDIKSYFSDIMTSELEAAKGVMMADFYDLRLNPYTSPGSPLPDATSSPSIAIRRFTDYFRGVGFMETGAGSVFQEPSTTHMTRLGAGEVATPGTANMYLTFQAIIDCLNIACWWDDDGLGESLSSAPGQTNPDAALFKAEYERVQALPAGRTRWNNG